MGHSRFTALSQSSVSRCISDVVNAFNDPRIFNWWVKFPQNVYELEQFGKSTYKQ
ncbi:putative nuclease HARBI1 [Aphis craccivora]|uniref:Putative nuclease HARBI1 n=1 Tax=Aphis craccivora TaxID=307492 RepID=A0A6G0VUD6_APHCR|nr:putative nuclease HARBI1 [Aphis craccivora]